MVTTVDRFSGLRDGLGRKAPCQVATTANITLAGLQTIDGVTVIEGARVVVKSQTDPRENGIYNASTGIWQRALDFNGNRDVVKGTAVYVTDGTANGGVEFSLTTANPVVFGTSNITFVSAYLDILADAQTAADAASAAATAVIGVYATASRATLAAVDTTFTRAAMIYGETGQNGPFLWNAGDMSAFIADTANYVAPATDPTGASGAWVRDLITYPHIDFTGMRVPAQGNIDLYVSTSGNDSTGNGSIVSHLRTANKAWEILRDRYDGRGYQATIWIVGLNNTPIEVFGPAFGFSQVYIQGYGTNLALDSTWGLAGFDPATGTQAIKIGKLAQAWVRGLAVANNAGHGIVSWWNGSIVEYSSVRFGACEPSSGNHIWATQGGQIEGYGYSVAIGGAGSHIQASHGGRYRSTTQVTYAGANITFGLAVGYALNGEIVLTGTPPTGGAFNPNGYTVTGKQWERTGYAGAIQAYGLQTPADGDFFGSIAGAHGSNT